jgi:hypothetical protein
MAKVESDMRIKATLPPYSVAQGTEEEATKRAGEESHCECCKHSE